MSAAASTGSAASCRRRAAAASTSVALVTAPRGRIDVAVVNGVAGDAELDVVDAALDRRLLGLVALAEEHRDRDRGEDADDDDHDQQLDEGEAPSHSSVRSVSSSSPRRVPAHSNRKPAVASCNHRLEVSSRAAAQPAQGALWLCAPPSQVVCPLRLHTHCAQVRIRRTHGTLLPASVRRRRHARSTPTLPDSNEKRPGRLPSQPPRARELRLIRRSGHGTVMMRCRPCRTRPG